LFGGFGFIIYFCTCRKKKQQAQLELPVLMLKHWEFFFCPFGVFYFTAPKFGD
jgi:hypothetical protein